MITNVSRIEVKIGERIYHLLCAVDSPLGEVHDALSAMKALVIKKMEELEKPLEKPAVKEDSDE